MLEPSEQALYRAAYYDGKSAVRHEVAVHLREGALDIVTSDGTILDQWLYREATFADQGSGGIRVAKTDSEARLIFHDSTAFTALRARAPDLHTREKHARRGMMVAIISTVAVLVGVYFLLPFVTAGIVSITPLSYETRLGKSLSTGVVELFSDEDSKGVCDNAEGAMALSALVKYVSQYTDPPLTYQVQVLDIDVVNAMALPGGYIYVFRGLLEQAEGEGELAGVLAHEMAHVDLRHPMHGLVRSYGMSMLSDMMFGGSTMGSMSSVLMTTSYSREAEEQADVAAIDSLDRAGLGAEGMAKFFERLRTAEEKSSLGLPGFLSTHPESGARERRARSGARSEARAVRKILTTDQWNDLRTICE